MAKVKSVGIAIPIALLEELDAERGDVSRSKFLMRIVERGRQQGVTKK